MTSGDLKAFARKCGADLVGVGDLTLLRGIRTEPRDLLEGYVTAISIGVRLADGIVDTITDLPSPVYQQHYFKVNALLDYIALRVTQFVQRSGGKALPIPVSHKLDGTDWHSYISHKAVALAAGLGWQGKSMLLVTPGLGPRVRLVTVLTDMALQPDGLIRNLCGSCSACAEACPVQAIKNVNTEWHYSDRNEALHFDRCLQRVAYDNPRLPFIETPLCGVCVRACPFGESRAGRKSLRQTSQKETELKRCS